MIRVAICDDHGIIRSGIERILAGAVDMDVVLSEANAEAFLEQLASVTPDIALLDIKLNDTSGLEILPEVLRRSPSSKVIMLSTYGARGYVEAAKSRGASGYLTKESVGEELISAIRLVDAGSGGTVFPTFAVCEQRGSDGIDALSSRELEVMACIASGMSNVEIADRLVVSPRTVESHRASLQRKLGVKTRAEITRIASAADLIG